MRMQDSQANCGSTALYNALQSLGIKRSMKECERLCNVTAQDGTSTQDLIQAASAIKGLKPRLIGESNHTAAESILSNNLRKGRPAILAVDDDSHWIAAVGMLGPRILVADSAHNELILSYNEDQLLKRWGVAQDNPKEPVPNRTVLYTGILL